MANAKLGLFLAVSLGLVAYAQTPCGTTPDSAYVNITEEAGRRYIRANGCPGYDWTDQTTPNVAMQKNFFLSVSATPKLSKTKTYVGALGAASVRGPIGIAVNGVALFGSGDAAGADAYLSEGSTFDHCKGHPNDLRGGNLYHYHAEPTEGCVYVESDCRHSPIFGVMLDGIPIFGPVGDYGFVPTDLDECGGHVDETYPFYHYHVAPNYQYPYLVNCLAGCLDFTVYNSDFINLNNARSRTLRPATSCNAADVQYDYSSLQSVIDGTYELPCSLRDEEKECRKDLHGFDQDDANTEDDNNGGIGTDYNHCQGEHGQGNDDDDGDDGETGNCGNGNGDGNGNGCN